MESKFDHNKYESDIYKLWEENKVFEANPNTNKKPFSIIMPPPNANDPLHIGHAMFVTLEDVLIRYHRMLGEESLYLPGTDHAGIETQFVFEKKLAKEDKSRFDFDRETLYQKIWNYVQENSELAISQMKRLGASADWSKFRFTLDPKVVDFVIDTFVKLNEDNLVYRGERLVNYCVKCGTGYSELEVEYEERTDPLFFIKYQIEEDSGKYITVATTRPEPIYVDTHLAVNPKDKKNKHLIGKKVKNPITGAAMEIIGDEFVDPEFGTGIVKLTPAHDSNDWEAAVKHDLPIISAIGTDGKMIDGPSKGKKVLVAREEALEILKQNDLVEKINDKYVHRVGTCYRCHSVIEPLPLPQFFIKTTALADRAISALDQKDTEIYGAGREAILRHWLNNLKDWNVSRQIVWGIRMPVWYDVSKNPQIELSFLNSENKLERGTAGDLLERYSIHEIETGMQFIRAPKNTEYKISKDKPGENYLQETDSFDTWFSSGQWPIVTLKTNGEEIFKYFYPTTVMETGYDILPIWVMRMMLLGIYLTNESPFKKVYLHGLIRDEQGRKMSKSIGNVINPINIADLYGADALRMALVMSSTPGQDKNVGENQIKGMRNFSNKIWNACRFVQMLQPEELTLDSKVEDFNEKFESELKEIINEVSENLDTLRIGLAAENIYNKFWHWYCDWAIEAAKTGSITKSNMEKGMKVFLKLLHPFVPFVTEAIWQEMKFDDSPILATADWPVNS